MQNGNPAQSNAVRAYKQGYAQHVRELGYASTSARHLTEDKYQQVMSRKSEQQFEKRAQLDWQDRKTVVNFLVVERDLAALCGAWECLLRGKDMGKLTYLDVQDSDGRSVVPWLLLHPGIKIPANFPYQIAPQGTKPEQQRRAGVVRLQTKSEEQMHLCFLRRLQLYLLDCSRAGISPSNFLFRPETADHQNFKNAALSSSNLNKRLQCYLQQFGIYENETLHGVRRGGMQTGVAKGATEAEIGAKALQVTPAVTKIYLDTSRETYGPEEK